MALINKSVTFTAASAVAPTITLVRQSDGTFIAEAHIQVTLSDGQTVTGSSTMALTTTAQQNATNALENALIRAWRIARGLES